jgi:hypothetical protein
MSRKILGCCSLCDKPILDVVSRWVDGPNKGEVREFGSILPGARRITLVLLSGATIDFSFCGTCKPSSKNLPLIWSKMLEAAGLECSAEWRKNHSLEPYNKKQELAACAVLLRQLHDLPLGVLKSQPYTELLHGR